MLRYLQNTEVASFVPTKVHLEQTVVSKTRNLKVRKVDLELVKMKAKLKRKHRKAMRSSYFDFSGGDNRGWFSRLMDLFDEGDEDYTLDDSTDEDDISDQEFYIRDVSYVGLGDDYELMNFNEQFPEDLPISDD
mmetsp:Transcript_33749/g.24778  ORF Transcript_33749/g.24778 Transcript_33749/m.24778 type:complete len:134 (-) Transcript_33749:97-498(-)